MDCTQEEKKRPVHWTWGGCGPGQLNLSGGRKTEAKSPCNCPFTQLRACSAESVRWEEKQKQNLHAIVPLYSCGFGQLQLQEGKNIKGIRSKEKQTGKTIIS